MSWKSGARTAGICKAKENAGARFAPDAGIGDTLAV